MVGTCWIKRVLGTVVGQGILDYPRILAALKTIGSQPHCVMDLAGDFHKAETGIERLADRILFPLPFSLLCSLFPVPFSSLFPVTYTRRPIRPP